MHQRKIAILLVAMCGAAASVLSGGPLTPSSGPIAPSYKTLTEVEPRTAINATNTPGDGSSMFVITQSGSYYLTQDIVTTGNSTGIKVLAPDVTIDLNGMSIRRGVGSTSSKGIVDDVDTENGAQSVTVRNGTIRGFSTSNGEAISFSGNSALTVRDLSIQDCGYGVNCENGRVHATDVVGSAAPNSAGVGLRGSDGTVILRCTMQSFATGYDVRNGVVSESVSYGCGTGVFASRSRVERMNFTTTWSGAVGIEAGAYTDVRSCTFSSLAIGVKISSIAVTVEDCSFTSSETGVKIQASDAVIQNNTFAAITAPFNVGTCISADSGVTRCTIANNQGTSFNYGISIVSGGNTVVGNRFGNPTASNAAIYSFPAGTRHGPVVKSATSPGAVIVTSGGSVTATSTLGSSDANANIYW